MSIRHLLALGLLILALSAEARPPLPPSSIVKSIKSIRSK